MVISIVGSINSSVVSGVNLNCLWTLLTTLDKGVCILATIYQND